MTDAAYWVELHAARQRLGAGFLLTRRFVLTALHCLRGLPAADDPLRIVLPDGSTLSGRVCDQDKGADLALIMISSAFEVKVPVPRAGVAFSGDAWHGPYRPASTEAHLNGNVDHGTARYQCEGGAVVEALQLTVEQQLGDYSGYSGGPVAAGRPGDVNSAVLGILLEQLPRRGPTDEAANVLFGATVGEAMRRFDHFHVEHLIDVLRPGGPPPSDTDSDSGSGAASGIDSAAASVDAWFRQIDLWASQRSFSPAQVADLKFSAAKTAIENQLGKDTA
ncbi:serine protease [Streptomyces sp. NPDC052114]|uniref:serine protease n=1 Tax=unclassified Streptomyces TaxID=2593676 RepID=UPI0034419E74